MHVGHNKIICKPCTAKKVALATHPNTYRLQGMTGSPAWELASAQNNFLGGGMERGMSRLNQTVYGNVAVFVFGHYVITC